MRRSPEAARVEVPRKRVPIRRRPMPCPHCDDELLDLAPRSDRGEAPLASGSSFATGRGDPRGGSDPELAASADAHCPSCGLPLRAVEVAGFWRRTAAGLVDFAILLATAGPLAWGLYRLMDPVPIAPGARGLDLALSLFSADFGLLLSRIGPFLVMATLYFMITVFLTGRTFGQRLLSIRVIDRHGQSPSLLVTAVRTFAQLAGTLAAAVGPLWIAIDSERRAVHDVVAGTYVVRSA